MYQYSDSQKEEDPPGYHDSTGAGVPSQTMSNPLISTMQPQFELSQPHAATATPVRPYLPLGKLLRSSQVLLYVVSYIQLVTVCVACCVFAYRVNDSDEFHPGIIATMVYDVAALVCAAVGLLAASGRSRVVMVALIILSLSMMTQGCILVNFYSEKCYIFGLSVTCRPKGEYDSHYYSYSNYQALLANLGINVALAISTAGTSIFMLIGSILKKDVTP